MGHEYTLLWLKAFALTCLVEVPLAAWLFRGARQGPARRVGLAFFANLASHPAVWFVFPTLGLAYNHAVALSECWAVASEAVFYALALDADRAAPPASARWLRAAGVALVVNGLSFAIGLLVRSLTGWI